MREEIEAGARLVAEFDRIRPVVAAFWLREPEDPMRYLYIATDQSDGASREPAYSDLMHLMDAMDSPDLEFLRVKVIGADNPMAVHAMAEQQYLTRSRGMRFGGTSFGGQVADDGYLYPPLHSATV